jgi:hypothetical protein
MDRKPRETPQQNLERVIAKNRVFLESAAQELRQALLAVEDAREVPAPVVIEAMQLYRHLRARAIEIEAVNRFLAERAGRRPERDEARERLLVDLAGQVRQLCEKLGKAAAPPPDCLRSAAEIDRTVRPPAEQWLRNDDDKAAFTTAVRLLEELSYPSTPPGGAGSAPVRRVEPAGRGFTLFSVRGAAAALDALYPEVEVREHDVVERYSAYEIRGVLTHLRRSPLPEISAVFQRLLKTRFPDVKCILIEIRSPDRLNDEVLDLLERTAGSMRPGSLQVIDQTD